MKKSTLKFIILLLLLGVLVFISQLYDFGTLLAIESIRDTIDSYGAFGPLVFIIIYIIATVFFIPGTPLTIAGGALFGTVFGSLYTVIGATIGATIAFFMTRYFGRDFIKDKLQNFKRLSSYDDAIEENGFKVCFILRFLPLFPFNGLNFSLGLTKMKLSHYIFGTLLGIIPGTVILSYFGSSLAEMQTTNIIIAGLLFIALMFSKQLFQFCKKRLTKKQA